MNRAALTAPLAALAAKARAHKLLSALMALLLTAALGAGGFYAWRVCQYRQSSDFALARLKEALTPPKPEELAKLVDFQGVAGDLAAATAETFPFFKQGPDQRRELAQMIQTGLLRRFLEKEQAPSKSKGKNSAADDEEKARLARLAQPLTLLPPDFLSQFTGSLALAGTQGDSAVLRAQVRHPLLERDFELLFDLRKGPDGWIVRHTANARELLAQVREAMLARQKAKADVVVDKNTATSTRMNGILPVEACTADAGLLSDGSTLLLMIQLKARNTGKVQVNNVDFDATVLGKDGRPLLHRHLNAAGPVPPGGEFDHRWTVELDGASDTGRGLLADAPLSCHGSWRTMGLSSSEVLHIVDPPDLTRGCEKPGHAHPAGFCLSPVFLH